MVAEEHRQARITAEAHAEVTSQWAHDVTTDAHRSIAAIMGAADSRFADALGRIRAYEEKLISAVLDSTVEANQTATASVEELQSQLEDAMTELQQHTAQAQDWMAHHDNTVSTLGSEIGGLHDRITTLRHENQALRKRLSRRDAHIAKLSTPTDSSLIASGLHLKTPEGVIPDSTRALVRELILLGLKVGQVHEVIRSIARAVEVPVHGSISERSIGRIMLETYTATKLQLAERVDAAESMLFLL